HRSAMGLNLRGSICTWPRCPPRQPLPKPTACPGPPLPGYRRDKLRLRAAATRWNIPNLTCRGSSRTRFAEAGGGPRLRSMGETASGPVEGSRRIDEDWLAAAIGLLIVALALVRLA